MKVLVNGEPRETQGAASVAEFVTVLGLPAPAILVEHNGVALRRDEWPERLLAESDSLEIIRLVAGG